jgi:hypothetical protein
MPTPTGRRLPLSLPRRLICDVMTFSKSVPTVPVERRMDLSALVAARQQAAPRPGWCALFTKAYAIVSARYPALRRAYLPLPWPHLYEHSKNVASVAVERDFDDEPGVMFLTIREPEKRGIQDLEAILKRAKEAPITSIGRYRSLLRTTRLPRPLRWLVWWSTLNLFPKQRTRHFGTFGVSVVAGLGACATHLRSPLTTALDYGVLGEDGKLDVRLTIDHRVLDAGTAARALVDLERVLCNEIVNELGYLRRLDVA